MSTKMKGLLKGLRYISQIFDNEKEQEMQIGHPTDVKHVAHIGWDGPTANVHSPSWMNEFKSPTVFSGGADAQNSSDRSAAIEETGRKSPRDVPVELPKSSRRQPFVSSLSVDSFTSDSPAKPRHSRRQCASGSSSPVSIDSPNRGKPSRASGFPSLGSPNRSKPSPGRSSVTLSLPELPRKSLRKKSRESNASAAGGSSSRLGNGSHPRASAYVAPFSDPGTGTGSRPVPASVSNLNGCDLYPTSPLKPGQLNPQCNGIS